jgi:hypothetical protein
VPATFLEPTIAHYRVAGGLLESWYNRSMPQVFFGDRRAKQTKRRWQFSLRGLLFVILMASVGFGLSAHMWFSPVINRGYHENGRVAWEQRQVRNARGDPLHVKTLRYYSNGQKSFECGAHGANMRFWLPSGEPTTDLQAWRRAFESDGGGTPALVE